MHVISAYARPSAENNKILQQNDLRHLQIPNWNIIRRTETQKFKNKTGMLEPNESTARIFKIVFFPEESKMYFANQTVSEFSGWLAVAHSNASCMTAASSISYFIFIPTVGIWDVSRIIEKPQKQFQVYFTHEKVKQIW